MTSNPPSLLRTLPPEIRNIIFCQTLVWNGKTPPLLKALRARDDNFLICEQNLGDFEVYQEALAIFYKKSTFVLSKRNKWSFGDMYDSAIEKIKTLHIDFRDVGCCFEALSDFWKPHVLRSLDFETLTLDADVNHLPRKRKVVRDPIWGYENSSTATDISEILIRIIPECKKLQKISTSWNPHGRYPRDEYWIRETNRKLKKSWESRDLYCDSLVEWFWEKE